MRKCKSKGGLVQSYLLLWVADIQFHWGTFVQRVQAPGKKQLDSDEGLRLETISLLLRILVFIVLFSLSELINHSQSLSRHFSV